MKISMLNFLSKNRACLILTNITYELYFIVTIYIVYYLEVNNDKY
jgi:hypothetical protein